MTIDEVVAREAIRDLVARYNANGDAGRFDHVLALFADDAVMIVGDEQFDGRDAIRALFERTRQRVRASRSSGPGYLRHFTSTHQVDLLDTDHGCGRCYFLVLMAHGVDHWGRYVDDYVRVGDRWLFARRVVSVDGRVAAPVFTAD